MVSGILQLREMFLDLYEGKFSDMQTKPFGKIFIPRWSTRTKAQDDVSGVQESIGHFPISGLLKLALAYVQPHFQTPSSEDAEPQTAF